MSRRNIPSHFGCDLLRGSLHRHDHSECRLRTCEHVRVLLVFALLVQPAPVECRARRSSNSGVDGIEQQIEQIYRQHNPEKLDTLPALFRKYDGIEQELLDAVKEKYGIGSDLVPNADALARQSATGFDTGGRIRVIDDLLSLEHQEILAGAWRHAPYTWGEQDTPNAEPAGTVLELELNDAAVRTVTKKLGQLGDLGLKVTSSTTGGQGWVSPEELNTWVPWRAYVNFFRRGDHPMRHKDNIGFPSVTVLVFPDSNYDSVTCGGETMFFESAKGDAVKAVTPMGGRAAVFDGDVFHSARPPLPGCARPRLTLAVKYGDPRHAKKQKDMAYAHNEL